MNTTLKSGLPTLFSNWLSPRTFFDTDVLDLFNDNFPMSIGVNVPSVNIRELPKEYQLELAAPGLTRNDFKIEVKDRVLSISSEKEEKKEEKTKENGYTRREFSYNSFCRTFTLPENANADKVDAKYENGVLKVSIAKTKETPVEKTRKITVS